MLGYQFIYLVGHLVPSIVSLMGISHVGLPAKTWHCKLQRGTCCITRYLESDTRHGIVVTDHTDVIPTPREDGRLEMLGLTRPVYCTHLTV